MRISEIYESVQGEGPRVGAPTIFVRFAGCNLRCPGWPCDTQHAIDPKKYRSEWKSFDPPSLFDAITELPHYGRIKNICWTGGEPFLQPDNELHDLFWSLREDGKLIECFSNGTLPYPKWATREMDFGPIRFVMDWKLPGSGEATTKDYWGAFSQNTESLRTQTVLANVEELCESPEQAIKFTVADRRDFDEAVSLWSIYVPRVDAPEIFVAPVWGKLDPAELVAWLLDADVPWRLNVQVHNYIWNRDQRGI